MDRLPVRLRRRTQTRVVRDQVPVSPEELADFYNRFYRVLLRHALQRHHLLREDARDIVQDVFALAAEKMQPEGNAEAWLMKVLDHFAANDRRKIKRRADLLARFYG